MSGSRPESAADAKAEKLRRIFRSEAIAHREAGYSPGELVRMSPEWGTRGYLLVAASCVIALFITVVGRVPEYASGPALVQLVDRTDVSVPIEGTLSKISVQPGQKVSAGDVLVHFYGTPEQRERLRLTEADVTERVVKAPMAGVVSDVRIRPGQFMVPGQTLLSIVPTGAKFSVLAMIPGQYRPLLRRGSKLRLELATARFSYLDLTVQSIGEQVVGRAETRRFLGQELSDSVSLPESIVIVSAQLPSSTFTLEGRLVNFYSGLPGTAYIPVRDERIIFVIMPILRNIFTEIG